MKRVKPGAYTFNTTQSAFSLYSTTNILLNDSDTGVVVNYTKAPLSGITTDKYVLAVDRPDDTQRYTVYAYETTTAGPLSIEAGWYWFNETTSELVAIDAPTILLSAVCTILNTVSSDQINAMFTEPPIETVKEYKREFWEGQRDTRMTDFEAMSEVNTNMSYNITDYPNTGITNAQMKFALTAKRLFTEGETFICLDDGVYTKGHIYKLNIVNDSKSWEDITKGLKIYPVADILNHDGIKSGTFTEEQMNNIKLADILQVYAIDGYPVYKYAYKGLLPTNSAQSTINANLYFVAATEKGNYVLAINTDTRNWEVREPASGDLQDYQIVTSEPEDKSQGKMIYEKSSGVTLGKAVVDKTPAGKYYSSPAGLVDKIFGGTVVPSDIETYEYLLFKENEYVAGYINIGNLPELTQYALTHDSIEVIFKVNNGAEQSDILTKNSDGSFGNATNKFQTMKSANLVEGAGSDYYTLDLQAGGVAQSFKIAETDTIQITKLKLGDVYINIDKGGSEGPFAIANLKISDGTKYNSLKDYLGGSPLFKHELEIAYSFLLPDSVEVNGPVMYHYLSNNGTQITNVSEIDDNFLLSGGIGKNTANTVLLLNITVIKAGSFITVEAVNASTMGYITGIVGTISDTVTQLI